jgi:hypothetical protein
MARPFLAQTEEARALDTRMRRLVANDLENIPIGAWEGGGPTCCLRVVYDLYIQCKKQQKISKSPIAAVTHINKLTLSPSPPTPTGLIVLWSAGMAVSAKGSNAAKGVMVLAILFTISRFLYTYAFVKALQPWRTVFWMAAVACVMAAAFLGIVVAFQAQYGN